MARPSIALLTPLILGLFLTTADHKARSADADPASPVVLRFVSWKPDHPRVWDEAIARFTQKHPHIQVVREIAPHSSTAYHDLLTQKLKNRDQTVDLFFMDVIWIPEFAAAGWARPLDDLFPPAARSAFLPATIDVGTYRQQMYGVPSRIDAGMLYYRADLLEKYGFNSPQTWDELVRQAETIVQGETPTTPTLRGYSAQFKQYEGLVCNMLEFVVSNKGTLVQDDPPAATLAAPETLAALRFLRERVMGKVVSRSVLTYQEPESLAAFVQGNAVFHRNWPYAWDIANDPTKSRIAGLVGMTALPGFVPQSGVAALGGWLYGISAYSQHPEEAWQFIEFLAGRDMQHFFASQAGIAPSRTALYSDPDLLAANPDLVSQFAILKSAVPRPRTPVYPAVSHVLQRFFSRALAYPDIDLTAEAETANRQINRLLELTRSAT